MLGTLIKFSFAILQSCQQRIVLDMYNKDTKISSHKIEIASYSFLKNASVFFSTQNFVHEFMRDILSLYCIVYTTILCSQLCKIANVNLIKGPGTPLFLNLNLCDRNFLIMHWLFFVFDSIDKYRIDSDRIIFKILRKKNLLFWIFPLWISSFTRKKTKENLFDFFYPSYFCTYPVSASIHLI